MITIKTDPPQEAPELIINICSHEKAALTICASDDTKRFGWTTRRVVSGGWVVDEAECQDEIPIDYVICLRVNMPKDEIEKTRALFCNVIAQLDNMLEKLERGNT